MEVVGTTWGTEANPGSWHGFLEGLLIKETSAMIDFHELPPWPILELYTSFQWTEDRQGLQIFDDADFTEIHRAWADSTLLLNQTHIN